MIDTHKQSAVFKVVGIGCGGRNAINHMVESRLDRADFICVDTDTQALKGARAKTLLQLGLGTTKGLGAGANPEVGRQAALEDRESIVEALAGADMIFIIVGMGGGTGSGAAPVVAEVAKELGILTLALVTMPCPFEGSRRRHIAKDGIAELIKHVGSLITISNNKRFADHGNDLTLLGASKDVNDILWNATRSIVDITCQDLIGVDFADVTTVLSGMGVAMVGTGTAVGPERAREAAEAAIYCPLLEHIDLAMAKGMLITITAGCSMTMNEFDEVGNTVRDFADDDAVVVIGVRIDLEMEDELRVTIVATGLDDRHISAMRPDEIARRKEITPDGRWTDYSFDECEYMPAFLRRPTD